VQRFC
jgi:hypothetical protein